MSRLTRYTQKLFGSTAGTNQMAKYGSFAAGSPARYNGSSITPAIIQSLSNYLSGWFAAVEGAYSPAIEDMNALCYLYAYQLAYVMQSGVAEWDSGTTYYIGSIAQDGAGVWYVSLTDNNTGNALTDGTKWSCPSGPGISSVNTVPYSAGMTLVANKSLMWPNMQIGNGQTVVVPNATNLIGITEIALSGSAVLQATGSGVIRVI